MKKFSSKKVLLFTLLIVLMFTVVAYAYTEGVGGKISSSGDDVKFTASVSTTLNASELNEISLIHEGYGIDDILFKYTSIDRNQYYNQLSDNRVIEDAPFGYYSSLVIGEIDYIHPNYADFKEAKPSDHVHGSSYMLFKAISEQKVNVINSEIAKKFYIDLNSYNEIGKIFGWNR